MTPDKEDCVINANLKEIYCLIDVTSDNEDCVKLMWILNNNKNCVIDVTSDNEERLGALGNALVVTSSLQ